MSIYEKLNYIQEKLKAPKDQRNDFGGFNYRSCEDILEAVKPICREFNTALVITDEPIMIGDWHYIKATAILIDLDDNGQLAISAVAREPVEKTKMDLMQITGATSSYARKYALNGLFCIDDTKDADTNEYQKQKTTKVEESTISAKISDALRDAIKNNNVSNDDVIKVLGELKHNKLLELKVNEVNKFKEMLGIK